MQGLLPAFGNYSLLTGWPETGQKGSILDKCLSPKRGGALGVLLGGFTTNTIRDVTCISLGQPASPQASQPPLKKIASPRMA